MNERQIKEVAMRHQDCIQPPYDAMMDMDGFGVICTFARTFGGSTVYIPSLRSIFGPCLDKDMLEMYSKGVTVRELVKTYGYSETHVRNLVKR